MVNSPLEKIAEELFQEWSRRKATAYARLISEEVSPMPGAIRLVESVAEQLPIAQQSLNKTLKKIAGQFSNRRTIG